MDIPAPIPIPPGVHPAALQRWLAGKFPHEAGGLTAVRPLTGGRSNLTFLVEYGERRLVLRRPPLDGALATAHDVAREHRVLSALHPTAVPVPRTHGLCADTAVPGAPFYVMDHVAGLVHRTDADLARLSPGQVAAAADTLVDVLVALHQVPPAAVGLDGFGRPEGFLVRQLRRWRAQSEASRTEPVPGADALHARLADRLPPRGRAAVVHGDFKLDNVLFAPGRADEIAAVLDWEMSTLGDPLTDLGLLRVYWEGFAGIADAPLGCPAQAPGRPQFAGLAERYAAGTGAGLEHLDWYTAFGYYKLAVILENVLFRASRDPRPGSEDAHLAACIPQLVERGHAVLAATARRSATATATATGE
ncbi:phosphotransferase family protein [Actinacidiphila sp. bgisy145]|uniref:phosphotransferase family protein n=1 Tax=Actinacidiphila sp. bgisy145 TaxID=3413792 RepID=UPI003EC034CA